MTPIHKVIKENKTSINPIWIMRQAGRYLPEFREIRKLNPDFIKLCLNADLSSEITLQPLKRFDLDAAIIFSDILMLPYGLNQKVEFKKDFGPLLGELNLEEASKLDEIDFVKKVYPIYKAINRVSKNSLTNNKSRIIVTTSSTISYGGAHADAIGRFNAHNGGAYIFCIEDNGDSCKLAWEFSTIPENLQPGIKIPETSLSLFFCPEPLPNNPARLPKLLQEKSRHKRMIQLLRNLL